MELRGTLQSFQPSEILQFLTHAGKTGILRVHDDSDTKLLGFHGGQLCYAIHQRQLPHLREIILHRDLATSEQLSGSPDDQARWDDAVSRALARLETRSYLVTEAGRVALEQGQPARAPKQREALQRIAEHDALDHAALRAAGVAADAVRRLLARGYIEIGQAPAAGPDVSRLPAAGATERPDLTAQQDAVVNGLLAAQGSFQVSLLYGVTGSGKTEIYLRVIEDTLARGCQALLLVPEIGLTPQLTARLRARFAHELAVLHSGLTDLERCIAWQRARSGAAGLIVGTRSAVFAALPRPGLIVVDEEHDPSYKQQTGFRYSARDLAIVRAQQAGIPVILGSATPSLESVHNARAGRYQWFELPERIGSAGQPQVRIVDLNMHAQRHGLSTPLIESIEEHLSARRQVILYLNRRGFAPTLICA